MSDHYAGMAAITDPAIEKQRRECEARDWLRRGYTNRARTDELMALITSKRGSAAAEVLLRDMREQWQRRDEWLGPQQ